MSLNDSPERGGGCGRDLEELGQDDPEELGQDDPEELGQDVIGPQEARDQAEKSPAEGDDGLGEVGLTQARNQVEEDLGEVGDDVLDDGSD